MIGRLVQSETHGLQMKYLKYPVPQKDGIETFYGDGTRFSGSWASRLEKYYDAELHTHILYMPVAAHQLEKAKLYLDWEELYFEEVDGVARVQFPKRQLFVEDLTDNEIREKYKEFCQQTNRNGSVLVGKSIVELLRWWEDNR